MNEGRRIDEEGNLLEEPGETDVSGNPIIDGELADEWGRPIAPTVRRICLQGRTTGQEDRARPGRKHITIQPICFISRRTTAPGRPVVQA